MVVYTDTVYKHSITLRDGLALTTNIVILSIFYCFLGSMLSYILYYIFDEYSPTEKLGMEWEDKPVSYQLADVSLEIAIIGFVSFWTVFFVNTSAPIIPVPRQFASFVDTYTTGMFFMYAVFIFLSDLSNKLKYLYETYLAERFNRTFPNQGSLLNLSLRYE